jgi:hypothetical protein
VADEAQILNETIRDAVIGHGGKGPTLKARGELLKMVGERRYYQILAEYGCDERTLKPGTKPLTEAEAKEPANVKAADRKSNPWAKENWNISRQGQVLKSLGPEKAAAIAKAVGCIIGQTKPNLNF